VSIDPAAEQHSHAVSSFHPPLIPHIRANTLVHRNALSTELELNFSLPSLTLSFSLTRLGIDGHFLSVTLYRDLSSPRRLFHRPTM
jgi:hypothetical protein